MLVTVLWLEMGKGLSFGKRWVGDRAFVFFFPSLYK